MIGPFSLKRKPFLPGRFFLLLVVITGFFFWPSLFKGRIPFPGDLLVGHYAPYNAYSFLGYSPGGVPHKAQGIDVVRELFPWKAFSVEEVKSGRLPFWNPYSFAGNPHLANFQTAIFYPLSVIFYLVPFNFAWTVFIFVQPLLAAFFTLLLLRHWGVGYFGGLIAGLAFGFGQYSTVWLEYGNVDHAFLWLPLGLLLTDKLIQKNRVKSWIGLLGVFLLSLLAGYVQASIYLFGVIGFYFIFRVLTEKIKIKDRFRLGLNFLLAMVFALGLSAFQLWPTLEIFARSARGAYPAERIPELLLPWFYPITNLAADFFGNPASRNYWLTGTYIERVSYVGVVPIFFALFALYRRRWEKKIVFLTVLGLTCLLMTMNFAPVRFIYGLNLPLVSTTVYTRLLSVFSFSLSVLAGFGFDFWYKNRNKKFSLRPLIFLTGLYLLVWLFLFLSSSIFPGQDWLLNLPVAKRNLLIPTGVLAGLALVILINVYPKNLKFLAGALVTRLSFLSLAAVLALTVFDLFFYFHKITPFSPPEFVYPETPVMAFIKDHAAIDRFWGYGTGYVDSNFSVFDRTFSPEGNDPLYIRRYGELVAASKNRGVVPEQIPRADAFIEKGFGSQDLGENFYRQRLLDLLGVKYVLHKNELLTAEQVADTVTFPRDRYQLVWQEGVWQVYENIDYLPRLKFFGNYQVLDNDQDIIDRLFDQDFDIHQTLILEKKISGDYQLNGSPAGKIRNLDYQPNQVKMSVSVDRDCLLFLSDNDFPGWHLKVNGQPKKIYRANYSFRAAAIKAGEHEVIFEYRPNSFSQGLRVSLLSLMGLGLFLRRIKKKKK